MTNTATGQIQFLHARTRTHLEDRIKELKPATLAAPVNLVSAVQWSQPHDRLCPGPG